MNSLVFILFLILILLDFIVVYCLLRDYYKSKQIQYTVDKAIKFNSWLNGDGEFPESVNNEKKRFKRRS